MTKAKIISYMDFFDFSEFSGEVALLGGREVLFVSFTLMKELESLKKKIKSLVVTLVDNEISVHNPALVTFDGEDVYIEIIVKEGTQYPLDANLNVKTTLRNKGKEKMVLKNITRIPQKAPRLYLGDECGLGGRGLGGGNAKF